MVKNRMKEDVKKHLIEIWATNFPLNSLQVQLQVTVFDILTGKRVYDSNEKEIFHLEKNQTTEITQMEIPCGDDRPDAEGQTVVAVYLIDKNGDKIARTVKWPELLKYVHIARPAALEIVVMAAEGIVTMIAEVPVKGLFLECERRNCFS